MGTGFISLCFQFGECTALNSPPRDREIHEDRQESLVIFASALEEVFFNLIKSYWEFSARSLSKAMGCTHRKLDFLRFSQSALYMSHCKEYWVYLPKQMISERMVTSVCTEKLCQKTLLLMM